MKNLILAIVFAISVVPAISIADNDGVSDTARAIAEGSAAPHSNHNNNNIVADVIEGTGEVAGGIVEGVGEVVGGIFGAAGNLVGSVFTSKNEWAKRQNVETPYECFGTDRPVPVTYNGQTKCYSHHVLKSIGSPAGQESSGFTAPACSLDVSKSDPDCGEVKYTVGERSQCSLGELYSSPECWRDQ